MKSCRLIWLLIFATLFSKPAISIDSPAEVFNAYLDALRAENWRAARACWHESTISAAERLGISFDDINVKYDLASPLIYNREAAYSFDSKISIGEITAVDHRAAIPVTVVIGTDSLIYKYSATFEDEQWKLVSPVLDYFRDWPSRKSRYFHIKYHDKSRLNNIAITTMDNFVDSLAILFNLSADRINHLSKSKINYYLCDESDIYNLTGFRTRGMSDFGIDAVLSPDLPHFHEIVHIIANYTLQNLPLYTLPCLQEGLACYLGGRWGRSPVTVNYAGVVNLEFDLIAIDTVLTSRGFYSSGAGAEAAYPVSSLLAGFLIHESGMENFKKLYLACSGTNISVRSLTREEVIARMEGILGIKRDEIDVKFDKYCARYKTCGIVPHEGEFPADAVPLDFSGDIPVKLSQNEFEYFLDVNFIENAKGLALLLKNDLEHIDDDYISHLFEAHFPGRKHQGERYSIKITPAEIGIYDYATNYLLASYVLGFDQDFLIANDLASRQRYVISKAVLGVISISGLRISSIPLE